VQAALDAAVEGDTVAVCDGVYDGPFVIDDAIDFTSGSLDPSRTTLVAGAPGESVVRVGNEGDDLDVTIAGFTISGGGGVSDGGGIDARGAGVLDLADLVVANNDAARGGGLALAGEVSLTRVEVWDNTAIDGGGIVAASGAVLTFEDTVVRGNAAAVSGGGVFVVGSLTLGGTGAIETNHAVVSGGGLYAEGAGAALTITGVTFTDNETEDAGGAIFAQSSGVTPIAIALDDTRLDANDAVSGGAMELVFATLETGDVEIDANTAAWGGGLHASDASVVDLGALVGVTTIGANVADIAGGGVYIADAGSVVRGVDAVFDGNMADDGGAIDTVGGDVDLTGGALTANEASEDGGAIRVGGGATAYLRGGIAADGNFASGVEQAVYVSAGLLVVCGGTNVTDPVANASSSYTFVDCYEVDGVNGVANECDGC
jgi:predicted outer membrane repeat protein